MAVPDSADLRSFGDEDLVALTQGGSEGAYAILVERYSDYVFTIAARILGDDEDAYDAAQEAFVRAYRAIGRFRGDAKFSSWLYRIATNRALTHLKRRRKRAPAVDIDAGPHIESAIDVEPRRTRPDQLVVDAEFRDQVRAAVAKLPDQYRTVITLFYLEQRSYKEVAGVMGLPMGTLKTHLHRGRAMLRKIISEQNV
jgi:RNA polymerase sigma-70 factor (ECF subfamily)